jgi:hypothetical protein
VKSEEKVGVCDVAALDDVLDVPHRAVERLANHAEARGQVPELAARVARVGVRNVAEEEEARVLELRDGAQKPAWRRKVVIAHIEISAGGGKQRGSSGP